jgi:hypothetical protein
MNRTTKINNHLAPQPIEHKKDDNIWQFNFDSVKNVEILMFCQWQNIRNDLINLLKYKPTNQQIQIFFNLTQMIFVRSSIKIPNFILIWSQLPILGFDWSKF